LIKQYDKEGSNSAGSRKKGVERCLEIKLQKVFKRSNDMVGVIIGIEKTTIVSLKYNKPNTNYAVAIETMRPNATYARPI